MSTEEALTFLQCDEDEVGRPYPHPHPRRRPIPGRQRNHNTDTTNIILPKWIYIKDKDGLYLTTGHPSANASLTFRSGAPDVNCVFQAIQSGKSWYKLVDNYGWYIVRYHFADNKTPPYYSSENKVYPPFNIISTTDNKVYLKDDYSPTCFFSNELNSWGAPIGHSNINETSLMEIIQAAVKNEIIEIKYDIPGGKVHDVVPLVALSTSVRNDSDGDVNQTLSYSYEKWSVGTWNNTAGIEVGTKVTVKSEVPFVNTEFEISLSASYSHEWGGEEGKKETITSSTTVTVPPRKKARANVIIRNAQIDVGFTYTQRILWSNGESEDQKKTGIYNNFDSWNVDVELDNWEDV